MPLQMNRREAICCAIGFMLAQPATTKKDQPQIHYAYTQKGAELTNAQGRVLRRCYEYELARYIIHPEQPEIALLVEDGYNPRRIRSSGVRCRIDMLYILNETDLAPIPLPQEGERIIEVSRSKGRLRILDNDTEVFGADVATGKEGYTTPLGTFSIWLRRWAQRMQGTIDGGIQYTKNSVGKLCDEIRSSNTRCLLA